MKLEPSTATRNIARLGLAVFLAGGALVTGGCAAATSASTTTVTAASADASTPRIDNSRQVSREQPVASTPQAHVAPADEGALRSTLAADDKVARREDCRGEARHGGGFSGFKR